jgi:O-antigen/teichoic acid export membrane protein
MVGTAGLMLNLLQTIIQVPILLHYWEPRIYGLWGTLLATISLVTSLDSGHQNFLGNRFCEQWVQSKDKLRQELASGVRAAVVLAAIEILVGVGVAVGGGLAWMGAVAVQTSQATVLKALAVYLIYWAVFGAVGGILVRLYTPAGFYDRAQWLGLISRLLAFLGLIAAASLGGSVLEAMAAQVIVGTVFNIYLFWDLRCHFPAFVPWWRGGNWATAWQNFQLSLVLTANGVVEQLASNGLILLVGSVLSAVSVALFMTVRTVANIGIQGANIMLNPLAPDLVRYHVKREGDKLASVFAASWFAGTSLITAGLTVGVFVLEPVYALWTRGALPLDRLLFAYLGAAVAVRQWAAPFQTYLASMNRLRPQTLMALIRAVLGLGLAAVLLPRIGLPAAGLGAFAAEAGAGVVAALAVHAQMRALGARFPLKSAFYALGQIGITTVVWLLFAYGVVGRSCWVPASLLLIALLAWWQWRTLQQQVKSRLLSLFRFRKLSVIKM